MIFLGQNDVDAIVTKIVGSHFLKKVCTLMAVCSHFLNLTPRGRCDFEDFFDQNDVDVITVKIVGNFFLK